MADDFDAQFSPETLMELGKLSIKMARNPKTRVAHLANVKTQDPSYTFPADLQILQLRNELAAKDEKTRLENEQRAIKERLEAQRSGLKTGVTVAGRQFDDTQIADIEKVMEKYGLSDYEAGAKLYSAEQPAQRPQTSRHPGATWTFPDIPGLMDDPNAAALNAAYGVIDEMRGARR